MSTGERIALEGLLAQISPVLAIEIGTAEGGSLARIATHSAEVHSFDLVEPQLASRFDNVTLHTGDSHALLKTALAEFAEANRNVDFALVDGDHSSDGVREDLEDLLDSSAVQKTVIVIHDINNPVVRAGVDAVDYEGYPKVTLVELDCVPGYVFKEERLKHELWGGLGVVVVDANKTGYFGGAAIQQRYFPAAPLLEEARDRLVAGDDTPELVANGETGVDTVKPLGDADYLRADLGDARALIARHERVISGMKSSASWRATAPLRAAKSLLRALR